jgi:uncharacterized protein YdaU (DUF1376 family)
VKHYPHHIGDFDKATRHLTRIERSVYRDLIDLYYDTEQRLTLDMAALCRRVVARSNEEATAVQQVLNEFFTETPTGWYHDRCEAEIDAYHANTSQKALAGKASAEAKRLKKERALNGESTAVEQPLNSVATEAQRNSTNHQPSTNQPINQEPIGTATTTLKGGAAEETETEGFTPTQAGAICKAIKRAGIPDVNPGHPRLRALIEAGATEPEFTGFARSAAEQGKGFAWVLAAVEGERKRAVSMGSQLHRGPLPQADTETAWQRSQRERVEEATGGILSKRKTTTTTEAINATAITLG